MRWPRRQRGTYMDGFDRGVTVTLSQLLKWMADSKVKAAGIAEDFGDMTNPDFRRGYQYAAIWVDVVMRDLEQAVAKRRGNK